MRTITFHTHYTEQSYALDRIGTYEGTKRAIRHSAEDIDTTQIAIISFDLLKHFDKIFLNVNGKVYELGLGNTNTWTDKDLRPEHDLLKIVTAHLLTDL